MQTTTTETANSWAGQEYPAAHSMDTLWFAVDETGEIGQFISDENSDVPVLEGLASPEEIQAPVSVSGGKDGAVCELFQPITKPISEAAKARMRQMGVSEEYVKHFRYDSTESCHGIKVIKLPLNFHVFEVSDYNREIYKWVASPERPMTLEELPEEVRNGRHLLFLKDYAFKSREPIDPFDYAANCFTHGEYALTSIGGITPMPIPTRWKAWELKDVEELLEYSYIRGVDEYFFVGVDEDLALAIFRTDGFGARPELQRDANGIPLFADGLLNEMSSAAQKDPALPRLLRFDPTTWQRDQVRHWLEVVFESAPPRLFGFYHYDLSWWHAGPYARIGVPEEPVRLDQFPPEWRERMNPVRMVGVRFAEARLVQPLERVSTATRLTSKAEVWLNEALTQVNLCSAISVKYDDDERLLRRAWRYYHKIEQLAR